MVHRRWCHVCWIAVVGPLLWLAIDGAGQEGAVGPPKARDAAEVTVPRLAQRVVVTRLAEPTDAGNARVASSFAVRAPLISRVKQSLALRDDQQPATLGKIMYINFASLAEQQERYLRQTQKSKKVTFSRNRSLVMQDGPQGDGPIDFRPGIAVQLASYKGTPALDPALLDKLVKHSLMITDLSVVEDDRAKKNGPWTFGSLITNLVNRDETGIDPQRFVERWLEHWQANQVINGQTVTARKQGIEHAIIDPWRKKSADGKSLDLDKAPFRLLAIVNRVDLRHNLVLGAERIGGGGAGEARFVFCAVDEMDRPTAFTVIFEYGIKKAGFAGVREWAEQWYELSRIPFGEDYNRALQAITDQFTGAGADPETPPNLSLLSQLRTNEIDLAIKNGGGPRIWEMREFRLDTHGTGYLRQLTVGQTPDVNVDLTPRLADFISKKEPDILAVRHDVPVEFPSGEPFLAGAAPTRIGMFWKADKVHPEARRLFSLFTCSGCHAAETFLKAQGDDLTDPSAPPNHFTHIRPRLAGKETKLSPFLTGKDEQGNDAVFKDPATGMALPQPFNDLRLRANDLHDLVQYGLFYELQRLPKQSVH